MSAFSDVLGPPLTFSGTPSVMEQSEPGAGESDAVFMAGLRDLPRSDGTAWFGDVGDAMAVGVIHVVAERQESI